MIWENKRALVVEDNADLARLVQLHLQDLNMDSDIATDGRVALRSFARNQYDLIVLDIMLPEIDGLEVCSQVRSSDHRIPILMLTAKTEEIDKVVGLELGADDYLTKPFGVAEFTARINALLRRSDSSTRVCTQPESDILKHGEISINRAKRCVWSRGQIVSLTAREFDLLHHFALHPGRVFTREELLKQVWGYNSGVYRHTVNSHINRLRAKIEKDPANPKSIVTVWGVGYKLADSGDA